MRLFFLRLFMFIPFAIFFGVGVHECYEEKYKKGLVMFATSLGFASAYIAKRMSQTSRPFVAVLIAATVLCWSDWGESAQLPASPFTLENPVTAPPTTPCSKACKCGCQQGGECDCEEFKQSQIRLYLEREYNWLPDEEECRIQRNTIDQRLSKLREYLCNLDGQREIRQPWHKGYEEMETAREVTLNCKAHEEFLWEVWNCCDWVTWPRDKYRAGCFPDIVGTRRQYADRLRLLVGDVAYFSGNLPR